jgi:RNA polymerase primary sigma factor
MPVPSVEEGLRVYLRQISRAPLLTVEQERQLGWRIINDDDEEARELLIVRNLRLVFSICTHYVSKYATLSDLIEEGNLALIHAVQRFDPAYGTRFSTYAGTWIRRSVARAVSESAPIIRVPAHMRAMIKSWKRAERQCERVLGRSASADEIAASMDVTHAQLVVLGRAMQAVSAHGGSVGSPSDQGLVELAEVTKDATTPRPEQVIEQREACAAALRGLDSLDARQAQVVRLRLGLDGRSPLTFHQIGREIGMTGEGARKAGKAGIRRLRAIIEPHRNRPVPVAVMLSPSGA